MIYDGVIKGQYIDLTSVTEEDAEFTLMVRQDARLTKYLPPISNTLEQQKTWINSQRQKEGDYYFIAKDHEGKPVGTIGTYDVHDGTGEGGRLTSIGNALQSMEIQYLILRFDFDILKLDYATSFVYADNVSALKLSKTLGIEFDEPTTDREGRIICNGHITKEQFYEAVPNIERMLYRR
ncbi:MAG: GNAT family N-acetyltransferase [Butyrivibrio sp.]|nr:GNAT family N-acetyltransferase [Butyrivibrio sp.]